MIQTFLSALVYELTSFLTKHADFFKQSSEKREELMAGLKLPAAFKTYLASVEEEHLFVDLRIVMQMINGTALTELRVRDNAFFKALVEFFTVTFAAKVDELSGHFYLLPYDTRVEEIKKVIESDNRLAETLRELLVLNSYQEVASFMMELSQAVTGAAMVLVQAPRDIDAELKKEMRHELTQKYPHSFPVFQVNRGLIGGFRVFVNGKADDHSWFTRIQRLTSLYV